MILTMSPISNFFICSPPFPAENVAGRTRRSLDEPNHDDERDEDMAVRVLGGDVEGAIPEFEEAIRLEPSFSYAFVQRGHAYRRKGQPARALADYRQAAKLEPALEPKDTFLKAREVGEAALESQPGPRKP